METVKYIINHCCRRDNININDRDIKEYEAESDIYISDCIICLDKFNKGETVSIIKCGHIYHTTCLYTWFLTKPVCPLCDVILDIK